MCCFSGTVEHVEGTRIFARAVDATRQALVYSMTIAAKEPVAMILPLPIALPARESDVEFINLEGYPKFFEDLERGFPVPGAARSFGPPLGSAAPLAVQRVGSFVASFVPEPADFARLDPRFRMPPTVFDRVPLYRDYGFAVFQLHDPNATIHPMAFTFPRRNRSQLFFPTVHVHDGALHDTAHFDHALYMQLHEPPLPPHEALAGDDRIARRGWYPTMSAAAEFMDVPRALGLIDAAAPVRVRRLQGKQPNEDILFM